MLSRNGLAQNVKIYLLRIETRLILKLSMTHDFCMKSVGKIEWFFIAWQINTTVLIPKNVHTLCSIIVRSLLMASRIVLKCMLIFQISSKIFLGGSAILKLLLVGEDRSIVSV